MTVNGTAYQRQPLVPRTAAIVCGSLQETPCTPTASDARGQKNQPTEGYPDLRHFVVKWPTPRATEYKSPSMSIARREKGMAPEHLTEAVKMWPTPGGKVHPNVVDPADLVNQKGEPLSPGEKPYDRRTGKARQTCLPDAVKLWPTPSTRDHKGGYQGGRIRNGKISRDTLDVTVQYADNQAKTGGQLSAAWVCILMGYPEGWDVVDGSAACPGSPGARPTGPSD